WYPPQRFPAGSRHAKPEASPASCATRTCWRCRGESNLLVQEFIDCREKRLGLLQRRAMAATLEVDDAPLGRLCGNQIVQRRRRREIKLTVNNKCRSLQFPERGNEIGRDQTRASGLKGRGIDLQKHSFAFVHRIRMRRKISRVKHAVRSDLRDR